MAEADGNVASGEVADAEPSEEAVLEAMVEAEGEGTEDKAGTDQDELEDAEIDGKKVRVTKGFKEYLLREQDYRHKTHATSEKERAIAEREKSLETERRILTQFSDEIAEVKSIDKQLSEYAALKPEQWMAWYDQDKDAADKARLAMGLLQDRRRALVGSLDQKMSEARTKEENERKQRTAAAEAALKAAIPDWSEEKEKTVKSHVAQRYGFAPDEVDGILNIVGKDPRVMRLLNDMHKQDSALKAARDKIAKAKAEANGTAEPITPIRKVGGAGANANNGRPTPALLKSNPDAWDKAFMAERKRHFGR